MALGTATIHLLISPLSMEHILEFARNCRLIMKWLLLQLLLALMMMVTKLGCLLLLTMKLVLMSTSTANYTTRLPMQRLDLCRLLHVLLLLLSVRRWGSLPTAERILVLCKFSTLLLNSIFTLSSLLFQWVFIKDLVISSTDMLLAILSLRRIIQVHIKWNIADDITNLLHLLLIVRSLSLEYAYRIILWLALIVGTGSTCRGASSRCQLG